MSATWRVEGRAEVYRGRDIMTPGGPRDRHQLRQGSKDLERQRRDVRVTGQVSGHALSVIGVSRRRRPATRPTSPTSNPLGLPVPAVPVVRKRLAVGRPAGEGRLELVAAEQRRARSRLREGHQREPLVRADRRPHRRRSPPTATSARPASTPRTRSKLWGGRTVVARGRAVRSHHHRDGGHAAQDELHAVRERRSTSSTRASASSTS